MQVKRAVAIDQALGFMQLYPSFSSVSLKRLWVLNDLFVRPSVRRGGVARRLLERARAWAVETGAKGLRTSSSITPCWCELLV